MTNDPHFSSRLLLEEACNSSVIYFFVKSRWPMEGSTHAFKEFPEILKIFTHWSLNYPWLRCFVKCNSTETDLLRETRRVKQ